jgi:biotin-dependent carboxylase-like uncharacterized protein
MERLKILQILSAGILTTVQDTGRYGFGRYGVAPSGALDSFSLRIANLLVGNREDEACLETMLMGPVIKALSDVVVAVTGGNLQPRYNGRSMEMWRSHVLKKDDTLSFGTPASGFRGYIAVGGGLDVPSVMGSKSTNLPSGFGGYEGRPLKKDDIISSTSPPGEFGNGDCAISPEWIPYYPDKWKIRVIWGPQENDFTEKSRKMFLDSEYSMSPDSDRTGIRLQGPSIPRKPDIEESIISEGVISGCIQIPGDGKPIIILGETVTGGYRKIATVVSADLPLLGQIKPGDKIRFSAVTPVEAHSALRQIEDRINGFKAAISK